MNKQLAKLILRWHGVYVSLGKCIESARVVLDQSDRGTLLPDRVREMRGEMLRTLEEIPALADLMEELTGEVVWPMKAEVALSPEMVKAHGIETETAAEVDAPEDAEPDIPGTADYDAEGSTPTEEAPADEEAAAEVDRETPVDVILPEAPDAE